MYCALLYSSTVPGSIFSFVRSTSRTAVPLFSFLRCTAAVGRTHTIVRLQTRIRRKDGTENFGGFVFVLDLYNGIFRCGFCVVGNFSPFSGYHAEGYHARTDTFKPTGYHICRVTTPELPRSVQTSGYRRVITPAGSF